MVARTELHKPPPPRRQGTKVRGGWINGVAFNNTMHSGMVLPKKRWPLEFLSPPRSQIKEETPSDCLGRMRRIGFIELARRKGAYSGLRDLIKRRERSGLNVGQIEKPTLDLREISLLIFFAAF